MNFFGKGRLYFRSRQPESDQSGQLSKLRREYRQFCESPVVTKGQTDEDFTALCAHESVSQIAVVTDEDGRPCLLVGLKMVILRDMRFYRLHEIGEMAIVMRRSPNAEMHIYNKSNVISVVGRGTYHHPHVASDGLICSNYQSHVMQSLAAGQVLQAVVLIIEALHTYGPHTPYCEVDKWPVVGSAHTEEEKDA